MNKKLLFAEVAGRYMPKCVACNNHNIATHKITKTSKLVPETSHFCCGKHIEETAKYMGINVSSVNSIKIQEIVFGDLYKTIMFFDQMEDITVDAFNDLLDFTPLCDKCECHSAIY